MITVTDLTYQYPKTDAPVLNGFSARFGRGEITAVSGRNGCGKTTLSKLLTGIIRPASGSVCIDDIDISGMDLFMIGRHIGYVFQNPDNQLFNETVYDEVAFGLRNLGLDEKDIDDKVQHHLGFFGLSGYASVFPGRLSIGEKQRLALAAVLAFGTDYLVLDEPTTGLDIKRRRELGELLAGLRDKQGCGIIIISHERGFISRFADREVVMSG